MTEEYRVKSKGVFRRDFQAHLLGLKSGNGKN
jgi:hypothetical protein